MANYCRIPATATDDDCDFIIRTRKRERRKTEEGERERGREGGREGGDVYLRLHTAPVLQLGQTAGWIVLKAISDLSQEDQ